MIRKFLFMFLLLSQVVLAQETVTVTGHVFDDSGFELPGASVIIKGTTTGASTNLDGYFELPGVNASDVLVVSFIGLISQEVTIGNQTNLRVVLKSDASDLEEVVVIGYGTSKSKDLTSPIASVSADEITSMNSSSAMTAVQGKVAGVNIVNSGVPGEGPSVSIRGVGSIQNSNPLYVVDGMFLDDINFLNPNDIETMSILKDASAAAIYGVRAANGVVLITTKGGGKNREMQVTYDGYYGVQSVTQRVEMANSAQYAELMRASGNGRFVDNAIAKYGGANGVPGVSTDWYDELIKSTAPIQNHNLSITGGNDKSAYAFSVGYFSQDGIMDATGGYDRFNLRGKVDYEVSSKLKIGFGTILTQEHRMIDDEQAWFQAYVNNPMYPVYEQENSGNSYPVPFDNPHDLGYGTYYSNPVSRAYYHGDNSSDITRFMPNIYAELKPWDNKDITLRSSMNMDFRYGAATLYTPEYVVGNNQQLVNNLSKTTNWNYDYVWDNTATVRNNWGGHSLTSMVGFSVREENYRWLNGTAQNVTNKDYLSSGDADTRRSDDGGARFRGMSAFTRFSYDYNHKYLLSLTMRADGSSKYQQKWGYFPSLGAGWVISQEDWASGLSNANVDFLKMRASWGLLGNDRVPGNDGFASIANGGLGDSGIFGGTNLVPGMVNNPIFTDLEWEMVDEKNIGIEAKMFDYRLSTEVDYYNRETRNMVILTTLPMGNGHLLQNAGSVRNSGVEVMVNWSDKIGDNFHYSIGGNITTIKNVVTDLSGEPYLQTGTAELPQRSYVGGSLYSFYGWQTDGVYQTQAEIDACPIAQDNNLQVGDFRYKDLNGDGQIDDNDRTTLGDPNPDFTYGINVAVGYKGWTLAANFQGVQGVSILNARRADINKHPENNVDANLYHSLWTGPESTNSAPSAEGLYRSWNNGRLSDALIEDGSYFRIQNVRLSYDIPRTAMEKIGLQAAQVFVNMDRPFTFFNSNGFTPEVPNGIDYSVYPVPAIFSLGARINF
ncbi:SusC/RagA family TonB-linked outer membrane protein [Saccharicrinis aurantiacus]|uniref:SusC/RagA family TonB-linked outer membrane protein n=1 Tax=Saccharicrinis aurantiacus TaxID=1849719 RepID=UPI00094FF8E2|nr:TonB-dependent receptor [Saccharicrinis aurantiacus]